eukprot:g63263.t1
MLGGSQIRWSDSETEQDFCRFANMPDHQCRTRRLLFAAKESEKIIGGRRLTPEQIAKMPPRIDGTARLIHFYAKDKGTWPVWFLCAIGGGCVATILYRLLCFHPDAEWKGSVRRQGGIKDEGGISQYGKPRLENAELFYGHTLRGTSTLDRFQAKPQIKEAQE